MVTKSKTPTLDQIYAWRCKHVKDCTCDYCGGKCTMSDVLDNIMLSICLGKDYNPIEYCKLNHTK